jgi:hypothetical protein
MSTIETSTNIFEAVREHLRGHVEQVGFFMADYDAGENRFVLREWRPLGPDAFEHQSEYHVSLRDEMRPEIIAWAAAGQASLIEIHSHGEQGTACFSPSDVFGFEHWVPHVRWRLRKRAYAAIVTAGARFDALAWIGEDPTPTQVSAVTVEGSDCRASGLTLPRYEQLRRDRP